MIIEAREDTITLRGEITTNIWAAIQAAVALLLENHPEGIIIDASGVPKVTTQGAETLADAFNYISSHNARIVVAGLAPELMEIGKTVPGVRSQLAMADTVEDARASLLLDEITLQKGKARIRGVTPLVGNWHRAVQHAARLASGEDCELHLVDLIQVPRTHPIGTPLPERETEGQARLEAAKQLIGDSRVKCFTHAQHVRSESGGLVEFVKELEADFAVVSLDRGDREDPHMEETEAMALIEAADFELSLVKGAPADRTQTAKHVVVPAVGAWDHALEHACKLVRGESASITVVYTIVIPRTEPINAPKPDAEAAASDCAKEAARIAKRYGAIVNAVTERVRDPILGFMKLFESHDFDLTVVGVKRETTGDYHIAHAIAATLLQELPCEMVFLRVGK